MARNIVASKKISFSDLCWTTALGRVFGTGWRGPVKAGQDKGSLISTFACSLAAAGGV